MPTKLKPLLLVLFFLLILVATATLLAQTSTNFNLSWHVIGGGGGESSSTSYRVNGTVGQSLASHPTASSASFTINSGYWYPGTIIYLPIILKN